MKTGEAFFYEGAAAKGLVITGTRITLKQFCEIGLPMVVACKGCTTTMNLFSCLVDEDLNVWCSRCAGDPEVEPMDKWAKYRVRGYKRIAKVPQRREIQQRQIDIQYGSEGPKYDPYAFTEYIVWQNGTKYVLHDGLATWLSVDGIKITYNSEAAIATFETKTGFTKGMLYRSNELKRRKCPHCGGTHFEWIAGHPGKKVLLC